MGLEIERKFLLSGELSALLSDPRLVVRRRERIDQTYLAIDETQELRVRRLTDPASGENAYTHTFKNGNGLVREEIEYAISGELYIQLTEACGAVPLTKERITATWDALLPVEIDRYETLGLTVAEVEFASVAEAEAFEPPAWMGEDITHDRRYSNKKIWRELQRTI
ncbi:CYTH domain-containing protein [Paenibacillus sp. IB182496]|uniref:CYTH domain-containing protein n=1 Tax=Paenibacillus sabuli TaxID=2772509 RepID=A0A927BRP9_9BACL|nr:CYTH domain-containing protein [Paenibacillus sabuli]MBD2845062.1 CYTH domain-containing protein [Paenibacillus sabuli]